MGLWNLLNGRSTPAEPSVGTAATEKTQPLSPSERADLESAWRELSQTLGEFNVTSLRACSREGRHWSEDPEAVRAIAGTIDSIMDDTSEGPKDSPAP
ncbi:MULTISPECIES: hypothetical protein [Paenarthrobacter]|uniref:Uncharacterized protein n=1 Tax=Paenarthrobacter ureafaciens TaxID=37931 RepID=A0AAX3EQ48_PAEUR|nr:MULTISPECIES: hypothetical protein [Paenarthrobacter]AOY74345.1 hypothetical protein ARZXY2_4846 [Arthrobacter sp. ZXY-2]MDO5867043.1 hypothetical protein [Paenarthrobacter sp. SD-2]MDO5878208.1 hypothetical protein [Paenarthrobacter sp. SD-1]UYV95468.1 hypothetical protein NL395_22935 [Paenarthrobacter ureafaciens]UYW00076.1 hypothetical protein NL394_23310 [Paenarthrobacter ureafaciens]